MKRLLLAAACAAALAGPATATPLIAAAEAGDVESALTLIRQGEDVNAVTPDGTTALHWAVHHGEAEMVQRLIRRGADVHAENHYGATPMMEAAVRGDVRVMRMLLDAGADVESRNADGQTALMVIARTENLEAARLLLSRGADPNAVEQWRGQTALMWAVAQNRPGMAALLLEAGADPNVRSFVNEHRRQITGEPRYVWRPPSGWTPLLLAAREGCLTCVELLLDAGADIDMGDPEWVSPLLIATMNTHFDTAAYLLARGANPNKWDWRGRNPLFTAVDLIIVPTGGRPDLPPTDKTTAVELTRLLLEAGANPNLQIKLNPGYRNTKDDRGSEGPITIGSTALARAAKTFELEAIDLLAAHGALVDLPNDAGVTPLMVAAGTGSLERDTRGDYHRPDTQERAIATIQKLLDMGADINAQSANGRTALFGAALWGWTDVVSFLAENGARLDIADNQGLIVLDAALGSISRGPRTLPVFHADTAERIRELMEAQGLDVPADRIALLD